MSKNPVHDLPHAGGIENLPRRDLLRALALMGGSAAGASILASKSPVLASHAGQPHIADVVDDFGAAGDGFIDDTEAIKKAIASITGGILFFPAGTYLVTKTLVIDDKQIILAGEGRNASIIRYEGTGDAVVFQEHPPAEKVIGSGVRDLKIEGTDDPGIGSALRFIDTAFVSLERVWVRGFSGPGASGLRINGIDFYLEDVHLQNCAWGMTVDFAFQVTAVNLLVNQNLEGGARFNHVATFRWLGGLVQGVSQYGVLFAPTLPSGIITVTLDGIHFEGAFETHVKCEKVPGGGTALTNVTIENNRFAPIPSPAIPPPTLLDFSRSLGLVIMNNRMGYDAQTTLLRLRDCRGVVVGLNDVNFNFPAYPNMIDVQSSEVLWLGGDQNLDGASGLGIGTPLPPTVEKLWVGGRSRFETVGTGVIAAGQTAAAVTDTNVGPNSHIMVTLTGNPGAGRSLAWVKNRHFDSPPGLTVGLTKFAALNTPFTYFVVN